MVIISHLTMRDMEVDLSLRKYLASDIYDSICLNVHIGEERGV